jgi:hypothetical protein
MSEPPVLTPKVPRPSDVGLHWAMLTLCSMVIVASLVLRVDGSTQVMLPGTDIALPGLCWFRRLLNINCPGCGLTRSFISVAHGRLSDAWYYNPVGPMLFAVVVSQLPYHGVQLWRQRRGLRPWQLGKTATRIPIFLAGALFAQWLVRLCLSLFG